MLKGHRKSGQGRSFTDISESVVYTTIHEFNCIKTVCLYLQNIMQILLTNIPTAFLFSLINQLDHLLEILRRQRIVLRIARWHHLGVIQRGNLLLWMYEPLQVWQSTP
jgi:hypothetical protein